MCVNAGFSTCVCVCVGAQTCAWLALVCVCVCVYIYINLQSDLKNTHVALEFYETGKQSCAGIILRTKNEVLLK